MGEQGGPEFAEALANAANAIAQANAGVVREAILPSITGAANAEDGNLVTPAFKSRAVTQATEAGVKAGTKAAPGGELEVGLDEAKKAAKQDVTQTFETAREVADPATAKKVEGDLKPRLESQVKKQPAVDLAKGGRPTTNVDLLRGVKPLSTSEKRFGIQDVGLLQQVGFAKLAARGPLPSVGANRALQTDKSKTLSKLIGLATSVGGAIAGGKSPKVKGSQIPKLGTASQAGAQARERERRRLGSQGRRSTNRTTGTSLGRAVIGRTSLLGRA